MKARSLFYFIALVCVFFAGCKKESIEPQSIVGKWYVERYTTYNSNGYYTSSGYGNAAQTNYESIGIFNFKADGTGDYFFDDQTVDFTYTLTEKTGNNGNVNSSSFNGVSIPAKTINDNAIIIEFDKSDIISLSSPIIFSYYTLNVTRYELFTKTKNTLRFTSDLYYNTNRSYSSDISKTEFLMTKQ